MRSVVLQQQQQTVEHDQDGRGEAEFLLPEIDYPRYLVTGAPFLLA
ncbi:hypothetical protein [Escherichia coli]|nr:hypothetical protein [Escherichia coli]